MRICSGASMLERPLAARVGSMSNCWICADPAAQRSVRPEKLHDIEFGGGWRGGRFGADVNLFWMDFRDEIVRSGGLDRFGQPITGNAGSSVHHGAEFGVRARPWPVFELDGNLAVSRNQFRDHVVY